MSTIARRLERLEKRMAPPGIRKVALAFCLETEDGRNRMTCNDLEIEQEPGETQEAFEGRLIKQVKVDMLIFVRPLERAQKMMPFVTTAGRVVLVPKKAPPMSA